MNFASSLAEIAIRFKIFWQPRDTQASVYVSHFTTPPSNFGSKFLEFPSFFAFDAYLRSWCINCTYRKRLPQLDGRTSTKSLCKKSKHSIFSPLNGKFVLVFAVAIVKFAFGNWVAPRDQIDIAWPNQTGRTLWVDARHNENGLQQGIEGWTQRPAALVSYPRMTWYVLGPGTLGSIEELLTAADWWPTSELVSLYMNCDGTLDTSPSKKTGSTSFIYTPVRPVPTIGNNMPLKGVPSLLVLPFQPPPLSPPPLCLSPPHASPVWPLVSIISQEQERHFLSFMSGPLTKPLALNGPTLRQIFKTAQRVIKGQRWNALKQRKSALFPSEPRCSRGSASQRRISDEIR